MSGPDNSEKKHRTRGFFRTVFRFEPRKWFAVDEVTDNSKAVIRAYKDLFTTGDQRKHRESFEEAVKRFSLTEETVAKQRKYFLCFSFFYLLVGISLLGYSFYLLLNKGLLLAAFVSFIMGVLMSVYAYKENFWYMQISKRKLGCTFREWLRFVFVRAKQ